ncbi:hypothetical protein EMIT0P294_10247 [Pseudomonas sp. IT-P294]
MMAPSRASPLPHWLYVPFKTALALATVRAAPAIMRGTSIAQDRAVPHGLPQTLRPQKHALAHRPGIGHADRLRALQTGRQTARRSPAV